MEYEKFIEINKIEFSVPSFSEIISFSQSQISNPFLYSTFTSKSCSGGLINSKIGSLENFPCNICTKNFNECSGHFGFLKLFVPVFNLGFIKIVHGILQIICKNCSRILLKNNEEYRKILKIVRNLRKKDKISRAKSLSIVIEYCRRQKICPYCNCRNGKIKKIGAWNFTHEIEINTKPLPYSHKIISSKIFDQRSKESILDPLKVFLLFQRISRDDFEILDLDPAGTRPENLLLSILPIPPLVVRPTISISSKISNEDNLTMRLAEIQILNTKIKNFFFHDQEFEKLWENWSILQIECARYLNSEILVGDSDSKNLTGIFQRLKGKNGRFRGSLGGKRVDFSGRSVISPDPNIAINSIGIPISVAIKLTIPEKISKFNRERLRRNLIRGSKRYPGANCLLGKNWRRSLSKTTNFTIDIDHFKEGNILERHIKDADLILFNRQPSLHRISIMAHRIKVMTGKTFRLNECVCKPYNADFDGDEMNIHVPQTQKARAEALCLMSPIKNFRTPRNGEPIITGNQDFLTFFYLLTSKDSFFSFSEISKIMEFFQVQNLKIIKVFPTIIKPIILWTGKQIFSWIFFPYKSTSNQRIDNIQISKNLKEKSCMPIKKHCFPNGFLHDDLVIVRNNELISGRIGKTSIGDGNKNSLTCAVEHNFSSHLAANSLFNVSKMTYKWFSEFGFTVSLSDMIPSLKEKIYSKSLYKSIKNLNFALKICKSLEKKQKIFLGSKEEAKLKKIYSRSRINLGSVFLMKKQYNINPLHLMFMAGSKGSLSNLTQMLGCLGQQTVDGKRINGDPFKTININKKNKISESDIILNGFIRKSFVQGLDNLEFFFHAMAGREGLVDTAVKTSETGYIQRKLSKTLEDLIVFYDSTVRNSCGRLIQFNYGEDDLNPEKASIFSKFTNFLGEKFQETINENFQKTRYKDIKTFVKSHALLFKSPSFFVNSYRTKLLNLGTKKKGSLLVSFKKIESFVYSKIKILNKITIEPGTSIGAIAAQSIGEPCTQMTLQTFHTAGTGFIQITSGIPRINEILNVSRTTRNSKIIFRHSTLNSKIQSLKLKIRLQKLPLYKIVEKIKVSFQNYHIYTFIKFKKDFLFLTGILDIYYFLCKKIKNSKDLWKKSIFFINRKQREIRINWSGSLEKNTRILFKLYNLYNFCKFDLQEIVFYGHFYPQDLHFFLEKNLIQILVDGENLEEISTLHFIEFSSVYSNNIRIINQLLGIEAARTVIISEIEKTFSSNGIFTDLRHLTLLSDVITHQGELIGITRHGLPKTKSNTLALASFEKTIENLFLSATSSTRDLFAGISENLIVGKEPPVGTGLVTLLNSA